eukprot:CAMPEP_0179466216 /NCGR_PEP_ID=MMETSP0799-20121207/47581_1 /TAXON_ID=46947 /ORGANISM="Geminigera cryophila, Strain CCMP2564" /LENGTH=92 /DNA_ID=CAMNT_0021270875 /DNA_START=77 /DNA_END=351 /DNA_ORIENTATION=-
MARKCEWKAVAYSKADAVRAMLDAKRTMHLQQRASALPTTLSTHPIALEIENVVRRNLAKSMVTSWHCAVSILAVSLIVYVLAVYHPHVLQG